MIEGPLEGRRGEQKDSRKAIGAALLLWMLAFGSSWPLSSFYTAHYQPNYAHRTFSDVLLDVVGDARTLMARYLWFKMDQMHEIFDEQSVGPFDQADLIPLMSMVITLDPNFEEAYEVLGFDLWRGHGRTLDALALTKRGLVYLPNSYQLQFRAAFYAFHLKRYPETIEHGLTAITLGSADRFQATNACRLVYHASVRSDDWATGIPATRLFLRLVPEYTWLLPQLKKFEQMKAAAQNKK